MRQKDFVQSRDDFSNYRQQCEARLKRLERYKKTKSFCSLDSHEASTSETEICQQHNQPNEHTRSDSESPINDKFSIIQSTNPYYDLLREKMLSMIETDMTLYNSLLTLGDKIQELRQKQPQRSTSETSLSSSGNDCDEDELKDELRPMAERQNKFSVSMSAITNLYVDDDNENESGDDETENLPSFQYFSRKNSILRIPIPARSSNRFLGTKIPRRPSELLRSSRSHQADVTLTNNNIDNQQLVEERLQQKLNVTEPNHNHSDSQISPPSSSQHSPNNHSTLSSCSSSNGVNSVNERKATLSAASIDSGIRDDISSPLHESNSSEDDQKTLLEI